MKTKVRGEKIEITPAIKSYIDEKIGKLDKYFENSDSINANVLVRIRNLEQIVEVTIPIKNVTLRAEERNKSLYSAIDLVIEKVEGQIRKNKSKLQKQRNKSKIAEMNFDFESEPLEENNSKLVKEKIIETKPMNEEEAILQMELIDHDFYVYKDEESLETFVVYRRKDGNYGLIKTK